MDVPKRAQMSLKSHLIVFYWPMQCWLSMWHCSTLKQNWSCSISHIYLIRGLPYSWWMDAYIFKFCMLCNFTCLLLSADFYQNYPFQKILAWIPSVCQTVWNQIRPDKLSSLIWVQTVYKGYQQTTVGVVSCIKITVVMWQLSPWLDISCLPETVYILIRSQLVKSHYKKCIHKMSQCMRFPTMWYVRPTKAQTSLRICAVWSEPLLVAWMFYEY